MDERYFLSARQPLHNLYLLREAEKSGPATQIYANFTLHLSELPSNISAMFPG